MLVSLDSNIIFLTFHYHRIHPNYLNLTIALNINLDTGWANMRVDIYKIFNNNIENFPIRFFHLLLYKQFSLGFIKILNLVRFYNYNSSACIKFLCFNYNSFIYNLFSNKTDSFFIISCWMVEYFSGRHKDIWIV